MDNSNASELTIKNVSDTALWVATFRANESLRTDALFIDPYAAKLAGTKGIKIANQLTMSRFIEWTVIVRTLVIDRMIEQLITDGVDLVVNLGAGLDTRPYRMKLPPTLRWIEVDFSHIIDHKEKILNDETPRCILERMRVDLSDSEASKKCFAEIATKSKKILVITEGVIPYLSNDEAATLAKNLHAQPSFQYWIMEYLSPQALKRMNNPVRAEQMQNAPLQFSPPQWIEFFKQFGWNAKETFPVFFKIILRFIPAKKRERLQKFMGFTIYERS
jgi:methyltransferase (TIGR00027 family)